MTYMLNLKCDTNERTYETKTDSLIQRMMVTRGERKAGGGQTR